MNIRVFKITAKTKLHVGDESGGEFTIIDKAIQRDPLTTLPCINSSSLKGAIKEYCYFRNKELGDNNPLSIDIEALFGSGIDENGRTMTNNKKGDAIFFDAKILYLPQQDNDYFYHYITSEQVIAMMNERLSMFGIKNEYTKEEKINGHQVHSIEDGKFISCCNNNNLPIIARNVLENGESQNLWYEQVLPTETVLYTIILEKGDTLRDSLNGRIVQLGAGATIGYGYCEFTLLYEKNEQNDSSSSTNHSLDNRTLPDGIEVGDGHGAPTSTSTKQNPTHNNDYQNKQYRVNNNKSKKQKRK